MFNLAYDNYFWLAHLAHRLFCERMFFVAGLYCILTTRAVRRCRVRAMTGGYGPVLPPRRSTPDHHQASYIGGDILHVIL